MTIQELINELQKIDDKSMPVFREDAYYFDLFPVSRVKFAENEIYGRVCLLTDIDSPE